MTETFDASWLDLREPVDHRSRAPAALEPLRTWWVGRGATSVLDLGCGTGSNVRYLAPRLAGTQRWTVVDHDPLLLGRVLAPRGDVSVRPVRGDLVDAGLAEVPGADLVTASALLDLVSWSWLERLVEACAASRCAGLFALSYDGTTEWQGWEDPLSAEVLDAVNEHQRRDKGLGSALGPDAARVAERLFRERGYETRLLPSPWSLGPEDVALSRALIDGWVAAASDVRPSNAHPLRSWGARASAAATHSDFTLVVGHLDLLVLPSGTAAR
jgi:SAM-dependent methyltransferase